MKASLSCFSVIIGEFKIAFSSLLDISSIKVEILELDYCVDILKEVLWGVLKPSAYISGNF